MICFYLRQSPISSRRARRSTKSSRSLPHTVPSSNHGETKHIDRELAVEQLWHKSDQIIGGLKAVSLQKVERFTTIKPRR
jgi:hypothetical protein